MKKFSLFGLLFVFFFLSACSQEAVQTALTPGIQLMTDPIYIQDGQTIEVKVGDVIEVIGEAGTFYFTNESQGTLVVSCTFGDHIIENVDGLTLRADPFPKCTNVLSIGEDNLLTFHGQSDLSYSYIKTK